MSTLNQSPWSYNYQEFQQVYLEMNVPSENHHKFYEMTNIGGGLFRARWGRIGAPNGQQMDYRDSQWKEILSKKINKGYVVERVVDIQKNTTVNVGQTTQTIAPQTIDKPWAVNPEYVNRIALVLRVTREHSTKVSGSKDTRQNREDIMSVQEVDAQYKKAGVLTRGQMEVLNDIYNRNK